MTWKDILSWLASLLSKPADPVVPPVPPVPPAPPTPPGPAPDPHEALLGYLIEMHSNARESAGLDRLAANDQLNAMARDYSRAMAEAGRLTHALRPDLNFQNRLRTSGYPAAAAGENIAAGQRTTPQVFADWMRSDGHRSNILNPAYREIGAGTYVAGNGVRYWCVVLGSRRRSAVAADALERIHMPETIWICEDPDS